MYLIYFIYLFLRVQPSITSQHGQLDVMDDCIKMFFLKTPPSNQFLCRAYLCQAQLNAPTSSKNPVRKNDSDYKYSGMPFNPADKIDQNS